MLAHLFFFSKAVGHTDTQIDVLSYKFKPTDYICWMLILNSAARGVYVYASTHFARSSYGAYRTRQIISMAVYFRRLACVISEGPGSAGRGRFYWAIMQRRRRPAGWPRRFSKRLQNRRAKDSREVETQNQYARSLFEEYPPEMPSRGPRAPPGARGNETEDRL